MATSTERRARVGAALDHAFGETFRVTPRRLPAGDANARSEPDPTRQERTFTGRFLSAATRVQSHGKGLADSNVRGETSSAATVTYSNDALPYPIAEGDRIVREATAERFVAGKVKDGGFGRRVLFLGRPAS